jgi:ubiquinone/menaquinone biosynthesis C-methylase UbiE
MGSLRGNLGRVRRDWRAFGPRYAAAAFVTLLGERFLTAPVESRMLEIEAERGVLGPALRGYRGHSVSENREVWEHWDWRDDAEDWTYSPEWKQALIDELLRPTMSAGGVILEIGPGGGRWSLLLAEWADRLVLVDVTQRTLDLCRQRLGDATGVEYVRSHGADFPGVADASVDRIWSYDAFVHIAPLDVAGYLSEMARVLKPGGTAVISHSGTARRRRRERGWRSPMTATLLANLAREHGLTVDRQIEGYRGHTIQAGDVVTLLHR